MNNSSDWKNIVLEILKKKIDEMKGKFDFEELAPSNLSKVWFDYFINNFEIIRDDINEQNIFTNNLNRVDEFFKYYRKTIIDVSNNKYIGYPKGFQIFDKIDAAIISNIIVAHVLQKLEKMVLPRQTEINSQDDFSQFITGNYWFRGQAEYEWKLLPSYYRSHEKNDIHINHSQLENDYTNLGIIDKTERVFKNRNLDYMTLSFIQHTMAFTPLLDFTKNFYTALSFAVSNYSTPRKLHEKAAAIYAIDTTYIQPVESLSRATDILKGFETEYIGSKPTITKIIKSHMWNGFMKGTINSEVHLFDIETNDRMRMQSGSFVLFDKVLFIGDILVVSTAKQAQLSSIVTKIRIGQPARKKLYDWIKSTHPNYQIQMLLSPYDFMQR